MENKVVQDCVDYIEKANGWEPRAIRVTVLAAPRTPDHLWYGNPFPVGIGYNEVHWEGTEEHFENYALSVPAQATLFS